MKTMKYLLMFTMPFFLMGCHTFNTEGPQSYQRSQQKVRYVETENIQWDNASEETQELNDEI